MAVRRWGQRMARRLVGPVVDAAMDTLLTRMLTEPYTENMAAMLPIIDKIQMYRLVETGIRAETGKPISRPLGSPYVLSDWQRIFFNPVHLFRMPTDDQTQIDTKIVIGPKAKRPLQLEIPIIITGMSYGGALSLEMKRALARGASLAGTATNTGEAPLVPEERQDAKYLIGQYNRGGWLNDRESLSQLDAIEIQVGQGAQGSAPQKTLSWITGPTFRKMYRLKEGENAVIHSRLPGVNSADDFIDLVRRLKEEHPVPVGLKFAATHHMERELEVAVKAGVDYVVVDGAEGGTHGGAPTLQDDVGLPTLFALARTTEFLRKSGVKDEISIIAAGGLFTPGHFLKAMALGADAVYIGTIAVIATAHTQMTNASPVEPPTQLMLYTGRYHEDLDIDEAAHNLNNFLKSSVKEMEAVAYSLGHTALKQVSSEDLCCIEPQLAEVLGVDFAGRPARVPQGPVKEMEVRPLETVALDGQANGQAADGKRVNGQAADGQHANGKRVNGQATRETDGRAKKGEPVNR